MSLNINKNLDKPTALTIGKFDGLHKGHRKLIAELKNIANKNDLNCTVLSFKPHPEDILRSASTPLILSYDEKQDILQNLGIDTYIEYPFTKEFSKVSPEDFMVDIVIKKLNPRFLMVGEQYRFGSGGKGDINLAKDIGKAYGLEVFQVPHVLQNNLKVSSSIIRRLIRQKNFEVANDMLTYNFFVSGQVIDGKKLGKTIGFATANIVPPNKKLLPPNGVYATNTDINGKIYKSITNIGINPTIEDDRNLIIESHLLNFNKDIYGQNIKIEFCGWLRDEVKFDSIEDLKFQLTKDVNKRLSI